MDTRALLSDLIMQSALENPNFLVLSGDHGYALFDQIRSRSPEQFINVGVAEQGMVGLAAGLARVGFRPMVYGLSSFIPIRVLEQIKVDVCFSRLPVVFLGDGAGLVYSTLGISHQCGEDIACLRPLPHIQIFSPCDKEELRVCYQEAMQYDGPSYIRTGKSDRPIINHRALDSTKPYAVHSPNGNTIVQQACIVSTGSMASPCAAIAKHYDICCISVPRIKPLDSEIINLVHGFKRIIVVEEHSRFGGLASTLLEFLSERLLFIPQVYSLGLNDKFSERCGSYQYALSEHGLSDQQLFQRIGNLLETTPAGLIA